MQKKKKKKTKEKIKKKKKKKQNKKQKKKKKKRVSPCDQGFETRTELYGPTRLIKNCPLRWFF